MSARQENDAITNAYAQALFNAAAAQGLTQRLIEEARQIHAVLDQNPEFRTFLEGPQISSERKREVVDAALEGRANGLILNLFYLTIDRERTILLGEIFEELVEIAERAQGIWPATLSSARELGFQEKLKLKTSLEKFTGCHLRLKHQVMPDLLGGIIFRFRDVLIDGSVRHGLSELNRNFKRQDGAAA